MKSNFECIFCFLRQAVSAAKAAGADESTSRIILAKLSNRLTKLPFSVSPPEMGRIGYRLIKKLTRKDDPYSKIKQKSNRMALSIYDELKRKVKRSKDPLLASVELAIAGNIIDFGVNHSLDIGRELKSILTEEKRSIKRKKTFYYQDFKRCLKKSAVILYLADNAGETVFDRVFIEEIKRIYPNKEIIYIVKKEPVINDALVEDAVICGIDRTAKIISSGSDASGTIVNLCNKEFKKIFKTADMIISKGQGNYETLYNAKRPIFFLLMAKCDIVAKDIGCKKGDIVLFYNNKRR